LKRWAILLSAAVIMMFLPQASAQTADGVQMVKVCETPFQIIAGAAIGAGYINFCLFYPSVVQPGATFFIKSTLTAPATVVPVFTTAANSFQSFTGCTEGTPAVFTPTTNGVIGTMWSAISTLSMTGEQCDGVATALLTIGAIPIQVYSSNIPISIQTENVRVDNYDYLCDATGGVPNSFSTTATTCNTPTINAAVTGSLATTVSGTLTLSGTVNAVVSGTLDVLDRICAAAPTGTTCTIAGLNVHQDQACGASFATRCYGEVSGITVNQTVGSVTVPSNMTLNGGSIPIQVGNARGEFFLGVLLWLVAFFVCLRYSKLLSAAACTLGVVVSAMQLSLGWQAACIGVLGLTLWLEALGRDKIILAFFNPDMKQKDFTE